MTPLPWNITASACQSTLPKGQTQHGKIWQALADIGRHVLIAEFFVYAGPCYQHSMSWDIWHGIVTIPRYSWEFMAWRASALALRGFTFSSHLGSNCILSYGMAVIGHIVRVGVCYGVPVGKCFNVPTCSYSTVAAWPHWEKSAAGLLSRGSEILVFPLLGAEASHWIDKVTATPYSEVKLAMPHRALKAKRAPHYLKRVQVLLPCLVSKLPGPSEPDGSDAVSRRDCRSFTRTSCSSLGNSAVTSKGEAAKSKKRWCRQCKNIRSPLQWPLKTYTVS